MEIHVPPGDETRVTEYWVGSTSSIPCRRIFRTIPYGGFQVALHHCRVIPGTAGELNVILTTWHASRYFRSMEEGSAGSYPPWSLPRSSGVRVVADRKSTRLNSSH